MTGRRHVMDSAGSTYEEFTAFLLGRIASLVRVPREKDFGIDFYGQPLVPAGPQTETVAELFGLQVKGGNQLPTYGGLDAKDEWRKYEFAWLKSLATPLYLVRVDQGLKFVELFSLWPLWLIFWRQVPEPYEIVFVVKPAGSSSPDWEKPKNTPFLKGSGKGDGMRWTVDLGPPFLRLTNEELDDAAFRLRATAVLRAWLARDRINVMRYQQFIPFLTGITNWTTNSLPTQVTKWQFWDSQPGANIRRVCQTAVPILVNLGTHLQWQNDQAAYKLIPILDWLKQQGYLDRMGEGLLDGLQQTQSKGLGPADGLASGS